MEPRKKVIRDFLDLVINEIEVSVKSDIRIQELAEYKNSLIIRSTKNSIVRDFINKLLETKPNASFNVFGNDIDRDYIKEIRSKHTDCKALTYAYDGRFDVNRMNDYQKQFMSEGIDAIVFSNYSPHTERYLNIEEVALCLSGNGRLPVFCYTADGGIYQYINLENHIKAVSLYINMLRWFHR